LHLLEELTRVTNRSSISVRRGDVSVHLGRNSAA
jgi:hypothetical protein